MQASPAPFRNLIPGINPPGPAPINTPRPHAFEHIKDFYHARAGLRAYLGDWTGECQDLERTKELWYATADKDHFMSGCFAPLVRRVQAPNGQFIPTQECVLGVSGWGEAGDKWRARG